MAIGWPSSVMCEKVSACSPASISSFNVARASFMIAEFTPPSDFVFLSIALCTYRLLAQVSHHVKLEVNSFTGFK